MIADEGIDSFERIKNGDEHAFRNLFEFYYPSLCNYASHLLNDPDLAEEVVQGLFVKIWEKRAALSIDTSLRNYLFRSVKNLCTNQIAHHKIRQLHALKTRDTIQNAEDAADTYLLDTEMAIRLESAINSLPDKRREIFRLSREEGLTYLQISKQLGISVKTVENQMGLALKSLREQLRNFLLLLLF